MAPDRLIGGGGFQGGSVGPQRGGRPAGTKAGPGWRREKVEGRPPQSAGQLDLLLDPGHKEPWIVAMDARPGKAAVLDYGARWCIEPLFSDFKSRGFRLEDTQLERRDRLARLMLIMALAMSTAAPSPGSSAACACS